MNKLTQLNKKIPKLRFPGFSGGWEEKKLTSLTHVYDGTHQTPKYVKRGVPFYSVEHLTANNFSDTKFIAENVFKKENKRVSLKEGDILMTRIGDIGTARLIDWNIRASFYVSLALIKKSERIRSDFLSQYINFSNFQRELWKRTIHVAFPKKINLGEIGECKLLIPSLLEQQKIAGFLGSVDEWIENLHTQKEFFELYKKGMMQKIFSQEIRFKDDNENNFPTWQEKKLMALTSITTGKKDVNAGDPKGKYPFYTCAKDHTFSNYYSFEGEAIMIAGNAEVGLCSYYTGKFEAYQRTYVLQDFKVLGQYLFKYLSQYFRQYALRLKQTGAMSFIKLGMLKNFIVPVPSGQEQQKIANFLISLDNLVESKKQQIIQVEQWRKGLIQRLFV